MHERPDRPRRRRVERGVYLQPSGDCAVFCRHAGRLRFRTVGRDLGEARRRWIALIAAVGEGRAPASTRLRFDTVVSWWLERVEAKVTAGERRPRSLEGRHLNNGLGRYAEASLPAVPKSRTGGTFCISIWTIPEVIEAAARKRDRELCGTGETDALEDACQDFLNGGGASRLRGHHERVADVLAMLAAIGRTTTQVALPKGTPLTGREPAAEGGAGGPAPIRDEARAVMGDAMQTSFLVQLGRARSHSNRARVLRDPGLSRRAFLVQLLEQPFGTL